MKGMAWRCFWSVGIILGAINTAGAQAPAVLPVQGYLTGADGSPIDGTVRLRFALYDADVVGGELFSETQDVLVDNGSFSAYVGEGTIPLDLGLFRTNGSVWVGVTVDGGTELPRFLLGSVPYAAFAEHAGDATSVGGMTRDALQARVTGVCSSGAISSINTDGSVACAPASTGDIEGVTAGAGLTGGGTSGTVSLAVNTTAIQSRVSGTCPAGQAIRAVASNGTVTCEAMPAAPVLDCISQTATTTVTAGSAWTLAATCPVGYQVTGGGWDFSGAATDVWPWQTGAYTTDTSTRCRGTNRTVASTITVECYARCCRL